MAGTKNSFSSILAQYQRLQNQILSILQGVTDATSGSSDTVTIKFKNLEGKDVEYKMPSFGYLEAQIKRIDETLKKLAGLDDAESTIRLPDGTYTKIFRSQLPAPPPKITGLSVPSNFEYSNNLSQNSLINPQLFVTFDLKKLIPDNTEKILYKRIILQPENETQAAWFDENLKGKNDISYETLLAELTNKKIPFFVNEDARELPPGIMRYEGTFDVYKIEDVEIKNTDGTSYKVRKYFLNTFAYTDILSGSENSLELKPGDKITVNNSIYEIETTDAKNKAITVKKISGFDAIKIGADALQIHSPVYFLKEIKIPVGFDERQIVFLKAVDKTHKIVSFEWSDGVAFYSNELVAQTPEGIKTLEEFYRTDVTDFYAQFLQTAKEKPIPAIYGEIPDPPKLDANNFKVVLINAHKLNSTEVSNINKKAADKTRIFSEIQQIDAAIEKKKNQLTNSKFNSEAEKRAVKNELDALIREKTAKSNLYASIIQELAALGTDIPGALDKPKYRVRGFFSIPAPKFNAKTGPQHVIQFIIEYRYLRKDGTGSDTKQFEFVDENGQIVRGTFSNWIQYKTDIRKKIYNEKTGRYEWAPENIESPEENNINQIDIPISKGEKVEIRVRSVSEAGWPTAPLLSDYSESVIIDFPEELLANDEATSAIKKANEESIRIAFQQELDSRGLDLHLSRSFTTGDKYFAHDAEQIASGFYTPEGTAINLYEKIKALENEIKALNAKIEQIRGELSVTIIDDAGNKIPVRNGDRIDIFAGYYKDYVDSLPEGERKGAIVTKIYEILIENKQSTPLELISRLPGGLGERLPNTVDTTGAGIPVANLKFGTKGWVNEAISPPDKDYNTARRYDLVPIVNNSIDETETNPSSKISSNFHQSQQLMSQFLYLRYTDVGLKSKSGDLYFDAAGKPAETRYDENYDPTLRSLVPPDNITGNFARAPFVWNYTEGTGYDADGKPLGNGYLTDFCIHIDHPLLNDGQQKTFKELQYPEIEIIGFEEDEIYGFIPVAKAPEAVSAFRHAFGINTENLPDFVDTKYKNLIMSKKIQQLNYRNNWKELGEKDWLQLLINEAGAVFEDENNKQIYNAKYPVKLAAGSYSTADTSEGRYRYILPDKCGFTENDRYLIGKNTCGAYLYVAPVTPDQLLVDGTDHRALKLVYNGESSGIKVPIIFQYRMTDYFGNSNAGSGIIGGYDSKRTVQLTENDKKINLTYTKAIGIDIYVKNETIFSFDIQVSAKYKRESLAQKIDIISKKVSQNREQIRLKKSQLKDLR